MTTKITVDTRDDVVVYIADYPVVVKEFDGNDYGGDGFADVSRLQGRRHSTVMVTNTSVNQITSPSVCNYTCGMLRRQNFADDN